MRIIGVLYCRKKDYENDIRNSVVNSSSLERFEYLCRIVEIIIEHRQIISDVVQA